jgi:hypothetical protein
VLLTGVAVLIGLVLGPLLPTRRNRFARPQLHAIGWLVVGVAFQLLGSQVTGKPGLALVLLSYAATFLFALRNIHIPGTIVLSIGLLMNALVIAANGGMPVHGEALVDANVINRDDLPDLRLSGHRHLERVDSELLFLDDRVPLPVGSRVVSFGDLVLAFATADIVTHISRRRRRRPPAHLKVVIDLREPRPQPKPDPKPAAAPVRVLEEVGV